MQTTPWRWENEKQLLQAVLKTIEDQEVLAITTSFKTVTAADGTSVQFYQKSVLSWWETLFDFTSDWL